MGENTAFSVGHHDGGEGSSSTTLEPATKTLGQHQQLGVALSASMPPPQQSFTKQSGTANKNWLCANCRSVVYNQDERCRVCNGIQVKIPGEQLTKSSPLKLCMMLERLSPSASIGVTDIHSPAGSLGVVTVSKDEDDHFYKDEDEELCGSSANFSPRHEIVFEQEDLLRPIDPVAQILSAVPSPTPLVVVKPKATVRTGAASAAPPKEETAAIQAIEEKLKRKAVPNDNSMSPKIRRL